MADIYGLKKMEGGVVALMEEVLGAHPPQYLWKNCARWVDGLDSQKKDSNEWIQQVITPKTSLKNVATFLFF